MASGSRLGAWLLAAALAVPADDALVVVNKGEDTVSILAADGTERARIATGAGPHEVAVSPDGALAVVTNYGAARAGNSLSVIEPASGRARAIDLGAYARPHGIAFIDSRRVAVTAEAARSLLVVEIDTGRVSAIDTGAAVSHMLALDRAARRAYVANIGAGSVTAIDLAAGRRIKGIATGAGAEGLDVSPDGGELWVANRAADTLSVVNIASLEVVATVACPGFPIRVRFTPDGDRVLVSNARAGDLAVFDARTRREIARIPMALVAVDTESRMLGDAFGDSPVPIGIAVSPDGRRAWVANSHADRIAVVDLARLAVTGYLAAGREPDGLAIVPGE